MRAVPRRRLAAIILSLEVVLLALHPLLHAAKAESVSPAGAVEEAPSGPGEIAAADDCILCRARRDNLSLASTHVVLSITHPPRRESGHADAPPVVLVRHATSQARAPPSLP
jgi:hypothetical protein